MKGNYKKEFEKVFNQIAYKHGHFQVFENFLDCAINGFCFNYCNDTMEAIRKRYNQNERHQFGELIKYWILISNEEFTTDNSWFDFFGTFYEANAISKQKGFAQFFTPPTICDFMVKITEPTKGESIAEPACGSGRFNLAAHAQNPKLFHFANDLDFTCVKMSALNFMIHGIKGVITCDDALAQPNTKFRNAFIVNDRIVPSLHFTTDYVFTQNYIEQKINPNGRFQRKIKKVLNLINKEPMQAENIPIIEEFEPIVMQNGQISLF